MGERPTDGIEDLDGISSTDAELVRSALERHMDRSDVSTAQTLQVLDKLYAEDYWTDQDEQHFGDNIADNEPGRSVQ